MMENTDYDQLVGSRAAPFINSLIARCGLATNYHAITHPSLPNYIGPVAGFGPTRLRPYDADCHPTGDCLTSAPSLFSQVPTWKAYQESMTKNCQRANDYPYYANGNPPMYFTSLAGCGKFDVPYRRLRADLVANTLPAFSWVTPNVCHQMHDCRIPVGDRWLRAQVAMITASGSYRAGRTALFITWDEGYHWVDYHCLGNTTDPGCHMATIVVSASTPAGTTSNAYFDHYSLLRTTEEMLGVITYLGRAAGAASMRAAFGL
jgi:hypothetical protein